MITRPTPAMETRGDALGARAVAFGVDAAVVSAVWATIWLVGTAVRGSVVGDLSLLGGAVDPVGVGVWLFTWLAAAGFAAAYFVTGHAIAGQTPGKRLADVVVVTVDGEPCDWRTAALRTGVLLAPAPVVALLDLLLGTPGAALGVVLVVTWLLVESAALALDDGHRRLGDRVAGTVVVAESLSTV